MSSHSAAGERKFDDNDGLDYSILASLGLIRFVHEKVALRPNVEVLVVYYHVTDLAIRLLESCVAELKKAKSEHEAAFAGDARGTKA